MTTLESGRKKHKKSEQLAWRQERILRPAALFCAIMLGIAGHLVAAGRSHLLWATMLLAGGVALFLYPPLWQGGSLLRRGEYEGDGGHGVAPLVGVRMWRLAMIFSSALLVVVAYVGFGDNRLDEGLWPWLAAIFYFIAACGERPSWSRRQSGGAWLRSLPWKTILLASCITAIAVFFRLYRLVDVPIDMTSDHAEKLLDVHDVLHGARPIFFPRNTGREAFQFYLTAALVRWTPLEIGHLALKVGTALFGMLTVPATYFLGKELAGRRAGLVAAFLLAVSHWHVTISRVGLRFPFTAAFTAPALYFLLRALRHNRRNDWLAAGAFLGVGLHTYTAMRIVPLLFVALVGIQVLGDVVAYIRARRKGRTSAAPFSSLRSSFWVNAVAGGVLSILLFLPLLRYMNDNPEGFWSRAASRAQEPMPFGELWITFWDNVKNALLMFNVRGDVVPMNTVPEAPVLGPVMGGLFVLGAGYLTWELFKGRRREAAIIIASLLLMLMPSILSLAFPGENPSVVRTGGAIPVVMIMASLPLTALIERVGRLTARWEKVGGALLVGGLLAGALLFNLNWYFERYDENIRRSLWNATEMGEVLRDFVAEGGRLEYAYHIAYPHWVDTRNIGINAGQVTWQNAITDLSQIGPQAGVPEEKLYLLYPAHEEAIELLRSVYPDGIFRMYPSQRPGKQFLIFEAPGGER